MKTNLGLDFLVESSFSRENGGRDDVPDLAIILTDGQAQNHTAVEVAAKRLQDVSIETILLNSFKMTQIFSIVFTFLCVLIFPAQ